MLDLLLVEDNERLRPALAAGLAATGEVRVVAACAQRGGGAGALPGGAAGGDPDGRAAGRRR